MTEHSSRRAVASALLAGVGLLAAFTACSKAAAPEVDYGYERGGWDNAAQADAQKMADSLRPTQYTCDMYAADNYNDLLGAYKNIKLPMPAASATCEHQGEKLTIEMFKNADSAKAFTAAKAASICERGIKLGTADNPFPGLPYVDGGTWIIEPDYLDTNVKLAPLVRGTASNMCPGLSAAPGTAPDGSPTGTAPVGPTTVLGPGPEGTSAP